MPWFTHIPYHCIEAETTDPETEVALNLICVDESTRKAIEIPLRPRPVKDLINEVSQFKSTSHEPISPESEHKTKLDSKVFLETKPGMCLKYGLD